MTFADFLNSIGTSSYATAVDRSTFDSYTQARLMEELASALAARQARDAFSSETWPLNKYPMESADDN